MKILIMFFLLACFSQSMESKLRLLSVVFRHGDRTPESTSYEGYLNDPNKNESLYPVGPGGLTNTGKQRAYELGELIRKTYGDFLGPTYYPGVLDARSTFIDRTKMSLQLVLAALYPPEGVQRWNDDVNWQPIPTRFLPLLDDTLMFANQCPRYFEYTSQARGTSEFQAKLAKFEPLMRNLTVATGKSIDNEFEMYKLYQGLLAVSTMGLELAEWTRGIFPYGRLYDGMLLNYEVFSYNEDLKRVNGGMLLRKITDDMTSACDGNLSEKRKLFLYSGHDFNIVAMLQALNVYRPHAPRYSSAVIFELHQAKGLCLVKVKYYKGIVRENESTFKELRVPGCKTRELRELKEVLKKHIATDDDIDSCDKRAAPEVLKNLTNLPSGLAKSLIAAIKVEGKNAGKLT